MSGTDQHDSEVACIELKPAKDNQQRVNYLTMMLERDTKRLELIDSHRHRNLAHALITFAAAYGAALKFLPEANPFVVSISLFFLAACFFLRDFQLHRYEHGWKGTIEEHLAALARIVNSPEESVDFLSYYRSAEKDALRPKEWISFNRWIYYLLGLGAISAGIILAQGWMWVL
jgi:hypothetical protein